jgi:hypothetical protein
MEEYMKNHQRNDIDNDFANLTAAHGFPSSPNPLSEALLKNPPRNELPRAE